MGEAIRKAARRPLAESLAHDQAQIEGTDVDQHAFEDVLTVA